MPTLATHQHGHGMTPMHEPKEVFRTYDKDNQRQYGKKEIHEMAHRDDKEISSSRLEMNRGGRGDSGENNGPTGSSRHYGKKAPGATHPDKTDWNPVRKPPSKYGIEGCG